MSIKLFLFAWHRPLLPQNFTRVILRRLAVHPASLLKEGPIAAFVNTIQIIGWKLVDEHQVCTGNDNIGFDRLFPWEASVLAADSVRRMMPGCHPP
jgi:hypothetical protein